MPNPAHGAECAFYGVVRDKNQGRDVVAVSYDAAVPLCQSVFARIVAPYSDCDILLQHRIGRVAVGEISVAIVVSSVHRGEAFTACRAIIEAVKHEAPIWKQEHYTDGDSEWLQGHALCK